MKKRVIVIFVVIIIGIILAFFLIDKSQEQFVYKGVWMPAFGAFSLYPDEYLPEDLIPEGYNISIMEPIFADLDKAEEVGINIFAFQIGYWVDETGEVILLPGTKEFFADFIDQAHARGFKIWLNPEIIHRVDRGSPSDMRQIPNEWIENTDLIENYKDAIVETAEFAEEHDVEIFSPSSEMYVNFGREKSKEVIIDVKSRIDAVYNDKICLKGEWPNPDFSDYSCFGPTIRVPRTKEEKDHLVENIAFQMSREDMEIELIMGELWEGDTEKDTQKEIKENFDFVFEAAKGKATGIFLLDTGHTYRQLFPKDFETVVKEYYSRY